MNCTEFKISDRHGRLVTVTRIRMSVRTPEDFTDLLIQEAYFDDVEEDARAKLSKEECEQLTGDRVDQLYEMWEKQGAEEK